MLLPLLIYGSSSYASETVEQSSNTVIQPPNIGNYSVQGSQQPGPLFAFGQFTIDRNQSQLFLNPSYLNGFQQYQWTISPLYVYGITDNLTMLINTPIAVLYYQKPSRSYGPSDTDVQFEYAFYNGSNRRYTDQATVVVAGTVPTGSAKKEPSTGLGAASVFMGGTFARMYVDWYGFISPGITWIPPNNQSDLNLIYYYDAGIGRNLYSVSDRYYWFALVEVNGMYFGFDAAREFVKPNSGNNIIFVSPSLIYATEHLYLQFGVAIPAYQKWVSFEDKLNYEASFSIGWTFN
ncbi:hypothetical protein [Legionella yabuuchiae]|uniref:hypothetical protein n=1 Tax=Legionella yabuuchiae TaxID=376727 RepID=UPI0010543FDB|nr:hypothetical protein [Legionella yabuuchiae]